MTEADKHPGDNNDPATTHCSEEGAEGKPKGGRGKCKGPLIDAVGPPERK